MRAEKHYGIYITIDEEAEKIVRKADLERQVCIQYKDCKKEFTLDDFLNKLEIGV